MPCHPDRVRRNYEDEKSEYQWREYPPKGTPLREAMDTITARFIVECERFWKGDVK